MLSVYRRHAERCKFKADRVSKKCRCPLWAKGTVEGRPYQRSLKTRSFERAEQLKRQVEDGIYHHEQPKTISVQDALAAFVRDCESRNLNRSTLGKYKTLAASLRTFAAERSCERLGELGSDRLRDFRARWKLAPRTAAKQLERLRAFFTFCVENDWITKNPAKHIKAPEIRPNPTLPFNDAAISKILAASKFKEQAFYRTLLHSGLRILDASKLQPEHLSDGKLSLYQQKTGHPVWLPLPPDLVADLGRIPLVGGFFFAVESTKPESIAEYYRKKLHKIQTGFHAHRFRDTFAVRLLQAGVPLEEVSVLLGHSSIKITEMHYAPWVRDRQLRLEELVKRTWETKLVRVK